MIELQSETKIKKTRKEHRCCICWRKIPKGFSAIHIKGKTDGEFWSYYLCNTCHTLAQDFPDSVCDFWEGYFDTDTFNESCSEYEVSTPLQLLNKLREIKPCTA